jgi:glycosyltransferase involved in cell wall biosynthesis
MNRVGVMHLVDSLQMGGTERVAVNLVNSLPRDQFNAFLCTTRAEGPLTSLVQHDVGRINLKRKRTWDVAAIWRLVAYIRQHNIRILHAHASSILVAHLASRFWPYPKIVWHDHYGINATQQRSSWIYRLLMMRVNFVLAVSEPLARWSRESLHMPANKVQYVPNFVCHNPGTKVNSELPGVSGARIVCVANLRPVKDHITLLQAMQNVVSNCAAAHLLLVGNLDDTQQVTSIEAEIERLHLQQHVSMLGQRPDVNAILCSCDIGVLSSIAEGLPLSLLEYGMAGLPVVSTHVGQCADVLDQGEAGLVVPSQNPQLLAEALLRLLRSKELRSDFGQRFQSRVQNIYSDRAVIRQITQVYQQLV